MESLRVIVLGGDEQSREALVDELFDGLRIMTRTDNVRPIIISTSTSANEITLRDSTTY